MVSQVNARRLINLIATVLAASALVGCGRVYSTPPMDSTSGGSGGFNQTINLPTGTVTGRVVNSRTKLGISGVQITLMGVGSTANRSTTTDGAGEFILQNVPAAKQKLALYKQGFTFLSVNGDVIVDVMAGQTVTSPDIVLTESVDAVTNAFVTSFTGFAYPQYMAFDAAKNYLYTTAKVNFELGPFTTPKELWAVKRFDTMGGSSKTFGDNLNWLLNESEHIFQPMGMSTDKGGNVFLCDPKGVFSPANPVKRYDLEGNLVKPNTNLNYFPGIGQPYDIQSLKDGFALVNKAGKIMVFNSSGQLRREIPVSAAVSAIAADANDNLYVIDNGSQNQVIKKYDLTNSANQPVLYFGTLHGRGANQFENPTDIAVDNRNGDFYVVDSGNNRVVRYSNQGTYLSEFGGMGANPGQFNKPTGIAIDNDGFVYISDTNNNRIQKFNPSPLRQVGQNQ